MNTAHYQLRLTGLEDPAGTVGARMLRDVLDGLMGSAERALRLILDGESVAAGRRPAWLADSLDFKVTGLGRGSTEVEIEAPSLGTTLRSQLDQEDFWLTNPRRTDTALDVLSDTIAEITNNAAAGERYDAGVLDSLMAFRSVLTSESVHVGLDPVEEEHRGFQLDEHSLERVKNLQKVMPKPAMTSPIEQCPTPPPSSKKSGTTRTPCGPTGSATATTSSRSPTSSS